MQPRLCRVIVIGLLLASLSQATLVSADEVGTSATVRNGTPQFASMEILFDARLGAFLYDVRATDPNGAPDLDRLIFHFQDDEDRLWTHTDPEWTRDGHTARWTGIAHVGLDIWHGPFRVHLHVYDRLDAEADAEAPATILSPVLDAVEDQTKEDPAPLDVSNPLTFLPLMTSARVTAPPQFGLVVIVALLLGSVVGVAYRDTRPRQRPGGRPPGRS